MNHIPNSPVRNPEEMNTAFAKAYNSGSIENLLALYESSSIHVHPNGEIQHGIHSFQQTLVELLQWKGVMVSHNIYCIPFENIALLRAHFILNTVDPDGNPIQMQGHTTEIVRKQPDGSWKYIVDHPFGADLLERARTLESDL